MVEQELPQQVKDERAVALGPGLVRRADGAFVRPSEVEWAVDCLGPIAFWRATLTYSEAMLQAEGEQPAYFLFPLPPQASIKRFELHLGDGEARVAPTVSSWQELPEGSQQPSPPAALAALFATESLPVLSVGLEPLWGAASGALKIELELSCGLPTVDGGIRLRLPRRTDEALAARGETAYSLEVRFEDGQEFVEPPASSLEFESEQDGESLRLSGLFESPDLEDLEISFRPGRTEMPVTRLRRDEENFIFSIFPPSSIPASPQRRDIVFILDASENMHGGVFDQVRSDLVEVLKELEDSDRFALVIFGRDIDGYRGGEFCELSELDEACRWLQGVEPRGRADVQPLLARIQSLPSQPDRQLCVFLLAAGHVGNEPAILRSLDFDQSDRRYYTVGIGPTSDQAFLRRLALLTRGRCEVAPTGDCREPLTRLLGQTRALLTEVVFEPSEEASEAIDFESLVPSLMTSLTPQGPVHCLGLGSPESLRFRSKDETGVFFAGTAHAKSTDNPALAGVWASLKVREMLDSIRLSTGAKRTALRNEVSELATSHGILVEDTVLVLSVGDEQQVQLSALPEAWATEDEALEADEAAVSSQPGSDFRRGLVARDGLFKGARMPSEGEPSVEGPTRHGLRSRAAGASDNGGGKPMLERTVRGVEEKALEAALDAAPIESPPAVEPAPEAEGLTAVDAEAAEVAPTAPPAEAVFDEPPPAPAGEATVLRVPTPVYSSGVDSALSARDRFQAYRREFGAVETQTALAALAGLPSHLVTSGPELPRILAQTVGHLEKRGYYSAALSVLGMLLQEYRTPEVLKKFEELLSAWVDSLGPESLPEALAILELGGRICPGSEALEQRLTQLGGRWREAAQKAEGEDGYQQWQARCRELERELPEVELPSRTQQEIWKLEQQQRALVAQVDELKSELRQQRELLSGLPAQLQAARAPEGEAKGSSEALDAQAQEELRRLTQEELAPLRLSLAEMGGLLRELIARPGGRVPPEAVVAARPVAGTPPATKGEKADPPPAVPSSTPEASREAAGPSLVELQRQLVEEPSSGDLHRAVRKALPGTKERIAFYRELVKVAREQPYHSLSLARAYRECDQTKVAVVHYQKYLRSEKDPTAYLELADAYDELGKGNLSLSARKAAQLYAKE